MFYIIAFIIILELIIKRHMEETLTESRDIFNGKVTLNKFHNKGIALSMLEKYAGFVKMATSTLIGILLILLCVLRRKRAARLFQLGLSMILGGALSNLIDRYEYGYVVDYFSFNFGKKLRYIVFNIADLFIMLGSVICILSQLVSKKR